MPADGGGGRRTDREARDRIGPEDSGRDQAEAVAGDQPRCPAAGRPVRQCLPESDGEGDHEDAGEDQVGDLDPAELTVGEDAPGVSGQVEPGSGDGLGEGEADVQRSGDGSGPEEDRRTRESGRGPGRTEGGGGGRHGRLLGAAALLMSAVTQVSNEPQRSRHGRPRDLQIFSTRLATCSTSCSPRSSPSRSRSPRARTVARRRSCTSESMGPHQPSTQTSALGSPNVMRGPATGCPITRRSPRTRRGPAPAPAGTSPSPGRPRRRTSGRTRRTGHR